MVDYPLEQMAKQQLLLVNAIGQLVLTQKPVVDYVTAQLVIVQLLAADYLTAQLVLLQLSLED